MATNIVYSPGQALPAPVPSGTKSGDPVRIGSLNGVAVTDRATGGDPLLSTGVVDPAYNWGGGNLTGNASVRFECAAKVQVTAVAAPAYGAPIHKAAAGLTVTPGSDPLWGHAVDLAPTAGDSGKFWTIVRISN